MVQKEEKRARGRPRSFDEGEVLEKARGVFWDLGYAATSLDDLARATGLNRPSLYGAFGDKRALYLATLRRTHDAMSAAVAAMLTLPGPLRDVLTRLYDAAIAAYLSGDAGPRGCFVVGTAVTEAVDDAGVRALLAGYLAEIDRLMTERIAEARAAGELPASLDPAAAGRVAAATMHSLAIRARSGEGEAALKGVAAAFVDLLCGQAG